MKRADMKEIKCVLYTHIYCHNVLSANTPFCPQTHTDKAPLFLKHPVCLRHEQQLEKLAPKLPMFWLHPLP